MGGGIRRRAVTRRWLAELGGLEGFLHFQRAAGRQGMEVALDLAIQASPDHPWVREHPEWFRHGPDGSIRYAENPPKRYQDVYPFDFHAPDPTARAELWDAWRQVVLTWVGRGVRIFRVDNPHTKPVAFWSWLIGEVQAEHPDVIFLAEAFTQHKQMRLLSKAGFTQSYTYFTWRTDAKSLRTYLTELTKTEMRQYYRGNLFTNTPDINPHYLARGRSTFVSRLVLAATLSGLYGIYSGFELLEHRRIGRTEEYVDSEKYEIVVRDWDAAGNLKPLIQTLNRLRRTWPALQRTETLRFEAVRGKRTLFYRKALPVGRMDLLSEEPKRWRQPVWVAVNVSPTRAEQAVLRPDLAAVGIDPAAAVSVHRPADRRHQHPTEPDRDRDPRAGPAIPDLHPGPGSRPEETSQAAEGVRAPRDRASTVLSMPLPGLTFLGHSTVLIELEGLRILTDPILVDRLMFLARVVRPVDPSLYADIDLVLLSHLHVDHFDRLSLARIESEPEIVTCPGGGGLARSWGWSRVSELAPGESHQVGTVRITATPAEHPGFRPPFGPRGTAVGYLIESGQARLYFAGDTDLFAGDGDHDPGRARRRLLCRSVGGARGWGPAT